MLRLWPSSSSGAASVSCDAIRVSRGSPVRSLDAITQIISSHVRVVTRISSHVRVVTRVSRAPDTGVRVSGSPLGSLEPITKITPCVSRAPRARVSRAPRARARVPVSSHLSCVCGSGFPRAFASSLICFVWRFPGNCRSGMSFQLMDPDAKLPKFTTRVAAAVSPS